MGTRCDAGPPANRWANQASVLVDRAIPAGHVTDIVTHHLDQLGVVPAAHPTSAVPVTA